LGAFFAERGLKLRVLLELGVAGGRTGVRDEAQLKSVLEAVSRWRESVVLSGAEIYEGVLEDEAAIHALLQRAVEVMRRLLAEGRFGCEPALLSGAGSAWYDVVAEEFSAAGFGSGVEIVLRPGCYLTHDIGVYREAQEKIQARNPVAREMRSGLLPALQVWAYVQSVPEAERAIIGLGKRDAAFDAGLPVAALRYRPGDAEPQRAPAHWTMTKMMDQHAYLQIGADDDVRVGDMIGFDISHPCLTFDKWRAIPVVNAAYGVVDVVETFF
jgi:D-serine dehydratase